MSIITGPTINIYPDTTIPGTAAVAMTAFQANGNSVDLIVTTTTGGCVSLTFTCERMSKIAGVATAYADVIDRDSVWSMVVTTPHTAGVYSFPLEGLALIPTDYYRLSYTANTAAGKLKVDAVNWENPKGGGAEVSVGDVVVDIEAITVDMAALEVLMTSLETLVTAGNVDLAAIETLITAGNVDLAAIETLITSGNAILTTIDADTGAMVIDLAAIEVLITAGNAILTTMDADTGAIKTAVESLAAGTVITVDPQTGAGAIAYTTTIAADFELTSITLHLDIAGTTNEDFTIGLDALDGVAYDTNLFTLDLTTDSVVNLVLTPQQDGLPQYYESGDELAFVWPNTEARTWGLRIVTKGV